MFRRFAFVAALTVASLLPSAASADEPEWTPPAITPVAKGTPAPYTGVLLTPEAVAKVIAEAKDCPKRVQVEVDRARGEEKARGEKTVADVQAGLEQRDGMIKDLTTRLEKSENARSNTVWYIGGGALAGAAVVILSVIAVGAAN